MWASTPTRCGRGSSGSWTGSGRRGRSKPRGGRLGGRHGPKVVPSPLADLGTVRPADGRPHRTPGGRRFGALGAGRFVVQREAGRGRQETEHRSEEGAARPVGVQGERAIVRGDGLLLLPEAQQGEREIDPALG